nr:translation initiation factor IF-1, chloroplastic [Ipomoea batatas]GMD76637.1 translation initiation factor IF-1, chloroplastic [Ipomoea batatas]GMD77415.1 translation initiation factor IF-1, chloroplastic [Ipomoea batatas]
MASLSWWRAAPSAAVPTASKALYLPPPPSKATNWASFRGKEYEKLVAKARRGFINSPRKMNGIRVRCQAAAEQKMTHEGSITESLPNGMFRVRLDNQDVILGYISGKIRKNFIRLLPGDRVRVEIQTPNLLFKDSINAMGLFIELSAGQYFIAIPKGFLTNWTAIFTINHLLERSVVFCTTSGSPPSSSLVSPPSG